jgi:PucR family transcriptional regulator, purine catabolism regulatory protein
MTTVRSIVDELGLDLTAGAERAEEPVRWVHISEENDPTPWLTGGELLLTSGFSLDTPAQQRSFLRRLAEHELAGLGFGLTERRQRTPKPLVEEARRLEFPLFEVPPSMSFIKVTKHALERLVSEQYDVLRRSVLVQQRLERMVLEDRGLEQIVAAISDAVGASVLVLGGPGQVLARHDPADVLSADTIAAIGAQTAARRDSQPFIPTEPRLGEDALARPIVPPRGGRPQAWVVIAGGPRRLGDLERLIVQQAVAAVGLELMRAGVAKETERRLTGDLLSAALDRDADPAELARRLQPFGIGEEASVLVFSVDDVTRSEGVLQQALDAAGCPAALSAQRIDGPELLCAIVDAAGRDPIEAARTACERLQAEVGPVRAGVSRPGPLGLLWRSFHEARWALEAIDEASEGPVASWHDLGPETLLLAMRDDDALRLYSDRVLGGIADDSRYGGELLRSLETFIQHHGQWERAARELYCHRHTLRYRMRKIEELTGRDLSKANDRIEFWLALRARELAR